MKLFETTQGVLQSHSVKVVKSIHAYTEIFYKSVIISRTETRETRRAFDCRQELRMLKSLFEVQLGFLPFTFSTSRYVPKLY